MKKLTSLFVLFAFVSLSSVSQKVKVVDETDLQPIEDVFVFSGSHAGLTNEYGELDLSDFSTDDSLLFQHTAYIDRVLTKSQVLSMGNVVKLREDFIRVNEIVVSQNRWEQDRSEIPNKIESVRSKDVVFYNPQTTADLVGLSDQVFVQKSQLGGGSPMIRGFSANRILLSMDGIRLNNAIYRSGNLQNIIMLDPNLIENSEVIFGPGSVIYGSDALGGVMDFHTRQVKLSTTERSYLRVNSMTRYSSANMEKTGHLDFSYGRRNWGFLSSISFSDFGDLRMGAKGDSFFDQPYYVKVLPDRDTVLLNDNLNMQVGSGYSQMNLMQKFRYRPSEVFDITYSLHYSKSSDIPRYDRIIEGNGPALKYSEWYYGPTKWLMHHISAVISDTTPLFDHVRITMAYQAYLESRHTRRLNKVDISERFEYLDITSVNIDADKKLSPTQEVYYGLEWSSNRVVSQGVLRNVYSGSIQQESSRYPDGGSLYISSGIYGGSKSRISDKLVLTSGIRANYVYLNSLFLNKSFFDFPFDEISINNMAVNGSLGFTYHPVAETQLNMNLSTGFRAPNLDDVGKIFDSEPGNVIVPNEDLKPEYAVNADLGIIQVFGEGVKAELTGFYTYLFNAMVRRDFLFNGQDSILYNGELSKVEAIVNADYATVFGFTAALSWNVMNHLFLKSSLTATSGEESGGVPLRHAAPLFGATHLIYQTGKLKSDFFVRYNGTKSFERMPPSELDKSHMYPRDENGNLYSPGWFTLNFNVSYQIKTFIQLNAGVENILDKRYRPYSSGITSPGRNFIITIRANI